MARKRRHVAASAAQRASATMNREKSVDYEAIEKSLETLGNYHDQLGGEVMGIPASLDSTLLLHGLVALVVQNVLMVVQSVSTAQIAWMLGTAVWMTRKSIVGMFLPHVALRVGSGREIGLRLAILVLSMGGLGAAYYRVEIQLHTLHLVAFAVVFVLDMVSVYLIRGAKGRLTRRQIFLSATEATFLVAGISICLNYKRGWIYDEMAFALTATTAFVHVIVLLTAKYVVLHCFGDMNGAFMKTQQRGAKLMEDIWLDIDRFEPEQLIVGASKKKKAKSKSRASASRTTGDYSSAESALQNNRPVFKEPRVLLAMLTLVQMLLLGSQLLLSAFVLYSWEMISVLMLSSSHVLWTLGQVRRKVLSRSTIGSAAQKLKSE
ncbi:hypothetical protein PC121_g4509 [Phytophthora cactorum]|nr:hypothetical protein PC120_g5122 [Phytophthora cactorum]KAG3087986.1 hypothetical protein PC121_g4509 [Phytophthora cactorum]KAG4064423.1 hypothetical protein PC123_g688 [Phytophthora cactorum]